MQKFLKYLWNFSKTNKHIRNILFPLYNIVSFNKKMIKGRNNNIINQGSILKKVSFNINGNNNIINIKPNLFISNVNFNINGNNHYIEIGEKCVFLAGTFTVEDNNCKIVIGAKTTVVNVHFSVTEPNSVINIGENCLFSSGISIFTGDGHSIIDTVTGKRINYAQNIKISNHVWVGANARILKGVSIGENSIIGTGSIVTKSIPRNVVAGGNPAKILRENVTWCDERINDIVNENTVAQLRTNRLL